MSKRKSTTRSAKKSKSTTPVRAALRPASPLRERVHDGLGAVENAHRAYIEDAVRGDFADSLEIDEAMRDGHEEQNRWDYLLGHGPSRMVIALEPHSAKEDEVTRVIKKKRAAMDQLRRHLADGARIHAWFWVASSRVHFADTERARRQLDQNGIEFVGTRLLAKHLPKPAGGGGPK